MPLHYAPVKDFGNCPHLPSHPAAVGAESSGLNLSLKVQCKPRWGNQEKRVAAIQLARDSAIDIAAQLPLHCRATTWAWLPRFRPWSPMASPELC